MKLTKLRSQSRYTCPKWKVYINRFGNANSVTKYVLLKGYWQVVLTERAKKVSAFVIPASIFQYKFMTFGIKINLWHINVLSTTSLQAFMAVMPTLTIQSLLLKYEKTTLKQSESCLNDWAKQSMGFPIYKSEDRQKCENYCPISILSIIISKVFERTVFTQLY